MALSCSTHSVLPTMSFRLVFRFGLTSARGEDAGQERAERAADGVDAEGVERVVVAERVLELGAGEERNDTRQHADDHGAGGRTKPAPGVMTTSPPTMPEQKPSTVGLLRVIHSAAGPGQAGDRGGKRGAGEGVGGNAVGCRGAARVEAVPADPQHAGAHHRQHQAVRREVRRAEALALAHDEREHERRPARRHVHDRAAREVDGLDRGVGVPHAVHEAVDAPHHVGEREVDDEHPAAP